MKKEIKEYCIRDLLYKEANVEALKEIKHDGIRLQEYLENSYNVIITKAHYLFRIILILVSALIGYIISEGQDWNPTTIALASFTLVFVVILLILRRVAYGVDNFESSGTEPDNVLREDIFKHFDENKNYKELLRFNIQSIQRAITKNIDVHESLVEKFNFASWALVAVLFIMPVILAIVSN